MFSVAEEARGGRGTEIRTFKPIPRDWRNHNTSGLPLLLSKREDVRSPACIMGYHIV
jgi:hypothetical protein